MKRELLAYIMKTVLLAGMDQDETIYDMFNENNSDLHGEEGMFLFGHYPVKYRIDGGATRCVLLMDIDSRNFLEEINEWVIKVDRWNEFGYTGREAANYKQAAREGLDEYFVPIFKGGSIDEYPFYIAKRYYTNEDIVYNAAFDLFLESESCDDRDEACDSFEYLDEDEKTRYYYESCHIDNEILDDLWQFLYNHDINDVHTGNIALEDDHFTPIIMDYAGFGGYYNRTRYVVADYGKYFRKFLPKDLVDHYKRVA